MQVYNYVTSNFLKFTKVFLVYVLGFFYANVFVYATDSLPYPNYASLVIDSESGTILHHHESKARRYPASLTKMMTLYILFDKLQNKEIDMNTKVYISSEANKMEPSNLPVAAGSYITIKEAIYALIVKSANNVSHALASKLGDGSVDKFITMMNESATELGLNHTKFANPHGLPNQEQFTTAYDMARLGMALQRHHPKYYKMFSTNSFKFRGKIIKGHNRVLNKYHGTDGIKTGYIGASGFNIITSVNRPKGKIIAVVMGGRTAAERDSHVIKIIDAGYKKLSKLKQKKSIYEVGEGAAQESNTEPFNKIVNGGLKIKTQNTNILNISSKIKSLNDKKTDGVIKIMKRTKKTQKSLHVAINKKNITNFNKKGFKKNSIFSIAEVAKKGRR